VNVLFIFGFPMRYGGHHRSGLALLKYLKAAGHCVYVMAPGGVSDVIEAFEHEGIRYISFPEVSHYPLWSVFGVFRVGRVCKKYAIDVIHAQDFLGIFPAHLAAILQRRGFVFTLAGGAPSEYAPPGHVESVFYSQELVDGMTEEYGMAREHISLVRARIDREAYKPVVVGQDFIKKYKLPSKGKRIVMAMRFESQKTPWIRALLKIVEQLCSEKNANPGVELIIAGGGPLLQDFRERSRTILAESMSKDFVHTIGPLYNPREMVQLYNHSHLVMGSGRGILEAMACRKPVVVLGEKGEAETVNAGNYQDVERYNFSGRHFRHQACSDCDPAILLQRLLRCDDELEMLADFSYEYIRSQMDARLGSEELECIYNKSSIHENSVLEYARWYAKANWREIRTSLRNRLGQWLRRGVK